MSQRCSAVREASEVCALYGDGDGEGPISGEAAKEAEAEKAKFFAKGEQMKPAGHIPLVKGKDGELLVPLGALPPQVQKEILNQASAQATKMIEEGRAAAARVQEQETQKAIAAAKDLVEKARQAAEAEHASMLTELRREVGRLVVATTAKVAGKVLTPEDQTRLADEANRQLAA